MYSIKYNFTPKFAYLSTVAWNNASYLEDFYTQGKSLNTLLVKYYNDFLDILISGP